MNSRMLRPFIFLVCLVLMVGLACNIRSSGTVSSTQPPSPLPPTDTPVIPTLTATVHITLPHHTRTPTPTDTSTPTSTATIHIVLPHHTHTPTPTDTFTQTPTATSTNGLQLHLPIVVPPIHIIPIIPAPAKLDYTANPNYGEANLSAGFTPDPFSIGITSGGDVDVSYLGGGCSGFASVSADLRVNFGGGGAALLRFYFIGSNGDPTMVINDPYGNYYCVDDSFGTVNPTIDFNNPAGGTYDIWIGSYASGTNISGTLYVTSASGNHP